MKFLKDLKTWKTIIQFIITVLTAIISSFFVQSCMNSMRSTETEKTLEKPVVTKTMEKPVATKTMEMLPTGRIKR